ncbi:hypothetical protein FO488_00400 [Geobacter sp. FeAm09]|uniref:hypothetical protein n=1 Tax=Geobacter sp. FeAm09 TaxID=2597769 RepID=UPI0011EBA540|nr:hypothetical protein [Geobacter sp. FeAm09]QEM66767.1 hypothetical protein FO488_00400 [Geobacter sp. FeAm09]
MIVRTFAVGLLLSAYLMDHFAMIAVKYFQYTLRSSPVTAFWMAINTLSPQSAHISGAEYYSLIIYIFACLGLGMAVAGIVYPFFEIGLTAGFQATFRKRQNGAGQ